MRIYIILSLPLFLLLSSSVLAQGPYIEKTSMPTDRSALCTAVVDGKIYAIGGLRNESTVFSVVEVYDPATDTWEAKSPMPTARLAMGCAVVNGKIYVIGGTKTAGSSILSSVEVYDPAMDTWETLSPLPSAMSDIAAEAVNGKIYVIGGSKRTGFPWSGVKTVLEYDPVVDTWTPKSDMPTKRWSLATCVIDEKIYAIGGNIQYPSISSAVQVYDPATDSWTTKTNMPTSRYSLSTCFVNGKIFAFGGWKASGDGDGYPMYKIVEVYNAEKDTWTRGVDMPFKLALMATETINGKIYIMGGTNKQHTFESINTLFEYDEIVSIPDTAFLYALIDEGVDTDGDSLISYMEAEVITSLDVSGKIDSCNKMSWVCCSTPISSGSIHSLSGIENFINLDTLICSGNQIESLDLSKITNLSYLDVSTNGAHRDGNGFWDLDIQKCNSLAFLEISWTRMEYLDISKNKELSEIIVEGYYENMNFLNDIGHLTMNVWEGFFSDSVYIDSIFITRPCAGSDTAISNISFEVNGIPLSTNSDTFLKNLSVFPNPTEGILNIKFNKPHPLHIEVYSVNGELVGMETLNKYYHHLDLSSFQSGIYFITLRSKDFVTTKKIMKL